MLISLRGDIMADLGDTSAEPEDIGVVRSLSPVILEEGLGRAAK